MRFVCGKTTTRIRVDAPLVNHYRSEAPHADKRGVECTTGPSVEADTGVDGVGAPRAGGEAAVRLTARVSNNVWSSSFGRRGAWKFGRVCAETWRCGAAG